MFLGCCVITILLFIAASQAHGGGIMSPTMGASIMTVLIGLAGALAGLVGGTMAAVGAWMGAYAGRTGAAVLAALMASLAALLGLHIMGLGPL